MNIPSIEITDSDRKALAETHRAFVRDMQQLTPRQQSARASVLASGVRTADPYTRALAQQMVDAEKLKMAVEAKQAELTDIGRTDLSGYRPSDPDFRARTLARKAELEEEIERDHARYMGLLEDDHRKAKRDAIVHFRNKAAREQRERLIMEQVELATAEAEQSEIRAEALKRVNARRLRIGKGPTQGNEG